MELRMSIILPALKQFKAARSSPTVFSEYYAVKLPCTGKPEYII